ncbi:hypothetical protein A5700_11485 [Mycobacterium sp. E1214]|nr:hypothetical protein A5700_11485 [Mycobacterium sp. E1214]OBH31978.1 hypothetical protein A5693_00170 [Mycobacterium sp. E1319]
MGHRDTGRARRWLSAVGVAAAVSLLAALIAGSALRPQYSAATLPEPAVWSHGAGHVGVHARPMTRPAAAPAAPATKKPFRSMWMTRERPQTWTRGAPPCYRTPLPASFAAARVAADGARAGPLSNAVLAQNLSTSLCIARC